MTTRKKGFSWNCAAVSADGAKIRRETRKGRGRVYGGVGGGATCVKCTAGKSKTNHTRTGNYPLPRGCYLSEAVE